MGGQLMSPREGVQAARCTAAVPFTCFWADEEPSYELCRLVGPRLHVACPTS